MNYLKTFFLVFGIFFLTSCGNNQDLEEIEESGTIETTNLIVSSQSAGKIENIFFDEGDFVEKGDTILKIESDIYKYQLEQAYAAEKIAKAAYEMLVKGARSEDVEQVKQAVKSATANFESAKKDKERFEELYKEKSITKKQYEDILTRYDIAEAQLKSAKENFRKITNIARPEELTQAEGNYEKAQAAVKIAKKQLDNCFVEAPISGILIEKFVEIGENVNPQTGLFELADQSEVELIVYIPEPVLGKVKLGQAVDIKTDSYPEKTYQGTVDFISSKAEFTPKNIQTKDERTKLVFAAKIKIANPNNELKAGMPADAEIKIN